jgi:maltose alpha-D-glucosyltransferase/alpha-amylase
MAQKAVHHQGSGWEFTIDELRRYYERVGSRAHAVAAAEGAEPPPLFAALENWYLAAAATLARRTAELHLTLASGQLPSFLPERLGPAELAAFVEATRAHGAATFDLLRARLPSLNEAALAQAEEVLRRRDAILDQLDGVGALDHGGMRIRVHGDYHLGQVLRTEDDFVIVDFEGEPARTLEERRAKQSPLKDVAGMLRSFSYAAYAGLFAFTVHAPEEFAALRSWADAWEHWVSAAYLNAYRATMGDRELLPRGAQFTVLLRAHMLEKALYELQYELNSRPEWVHIPLTGILKLALPLQS